MVRRVGQSDCSLFRLTLDMEGERRACLILLLNGLVLSLLVTPALCSCEQPCSSNFPGADTCEAVAAECGHVAENSAPPSAPTNLRPSDFIYHYVDGSATTLGLNVTWRLPVNVTGLRGFFIHVIKTSYPVGSQFCKKVNFTPMSASPPSASQITFSLDCLKIIYVDGWYNITVASLGSGQSITRTFKAKSCNEVPDVDGCLDCLGEHCRPFARPTDWRPGDPTASAFENRGWNIRVSFEVYPGDLWLKYRVNLYSYKLDKVPDGFSHFVNSSGQRGWMEHVFQDVLPGRYKVKVKIFPGDTIQVSSNDVNIPIVTATPDTMPTSPVSEATAEEANKNANSGLIKDLPTTIGVIGSVLIAVVLLVGLLAWTVRKKHHSAGSSDGTGDFTSGVTPHFDDTSNLANNMLPNEDKVMKQGQSQKLNVQQNHYEWTEGSVGDLCCSADYDSQFDYNDLKPRVHRLENIDDLEPSELLSIAGKSGETV